MAGLFGKGSQAYKTTTYTSVDIQTSSAGVPIPILWGRNRIGTNVLDLVNFGSHAAKGGGKGGKGGGGGKGGSQRDYTTAVILGLGEGPMQSIQAVYQDQSTVSPASINLSFFSGTLGQAPAAWMVSNYPDHALSYSETAYMFSSLYDLGSSPALPNHNFDVFGFMAGSSVPGHDDVNMGDVIPDFVANLQYGLDPGATYVDSTSLTLFKLYQRAQNLVFSPYLHSAEQGVSIIQRWAQLSNSFIFWAGDSMKFVPLGDVTVSGNGVTYTPSINPLFTFTLDDFIFNGSSEDPITVDRIDPADGYNNVEIDVRDRGNNYATDPIRWQDQASVDQYGQLQSVIISADEICAPEVGAICAMLIGKRAAYIRNSAYKFKLGPIGCILEPGDIIALTEPNLGLDAFTVRILEVSEDQPNVVSITAEEFSAGIGSATLFTPQVASPTPNPDTFAAPGDINPPLILEPSPTFTNGLAQIWFGASGASPDWGGCDVYISADGMSYGWIGQITRATIQGQLTASLANASGLDNTNTLSVDTTESQTALSADVTHADADAFRTASMVGSEVLSYGELINTSSFGADMKYLQRGIYGTTNSSHAIGTQFSRIDPSAVLVYGMPEEYIGQPLYFKFPSFNIFGAGQQDISSVTPYTITPAGPAFNISPPTSLVLSTGAGVTTVFMLLTWVGSLGPNVGSYEAELSSDGGTTWTLGGTCGAEQLYFTFSPVIGSTSYTARVRAISQSGLAISGWVQIGPVISATQPSSGGGVLPLTNGDPAPSGVMVDPDGQIVGVSV